ncbi:MAG: bifunctional transaldolase/phosoglucose isomerase, partial [Nannocystaceae bacterium]|nr:bifunctional transaldolase/phosoglucose isomerase [Nannocystaceae bacterium]
GSRLASLASFSVGRIDAEVDRRLDEMLDRTTDEAHAAQLRSLKGVTAVANATLAYEIYQRAVDAPRWQALAEQGVRPQRLSWVSAGLEEAPESGALFAEKLIGRDTVQTMPRATLDALSSRGTTDATLGTGLEVARDTMERLEALGISMGELTDYLLERGVERLEDTMDDLLGTIALVQRRYRGTRLNRLQATLPAALADGVGATLKDWDSQQNTRRLWNRDATLWTDSGEDGWLGWLDLVDRQRKNIEYFQEIAHMVERRNFTHVLVLGVGGCGLAPDLLSRIYEDPSGFPSLSVLDSTDPTQILDAEAGVELATTLLIVSSKSGTTLETSALLSYFWERMHTELGDAAPRHFLALTDPGSALDDFAREHGFWTVQHGAPELRGRYSMFSNFGMVPAAAMGMPVTDFLEETALMVGACGNVPAAENPGVELGVILGAAANRGRDKLTLITSPAIAPLGTWLEQLIAESTGKHGKAIVAHEREPLLEPHAYSNDRVFVYIRLDSTPHLDQDRAVAGLADAGHPVIQITLDDTWSLGQELFRWQIATAVAAAVMGVNPFDEPDIEPSKRETLALITAYERSGALPSESQLWSGEGVTLFANNANAKALHAIVGDHPSLAGWLSAHFSRMRPRDYVAVLAYLPMTIDYERTLHEIRGVVLQATGVATSVGFGPRLLNSTGQAYKGGPNTGLFLQLTCDDAQDLAIPGQRATFGAVKAAQARGDFEVLGERGRRALRVHLSSDTEVGLQTLLTAIELALASHAEAQEY